MVDGVKLFADSFGLNMRRRAAQDFKKIVHIGVELLVEQNTKKPGYWALSDYVGGDYHKRMVLYGQLKAWLQPLLGSTEWHDAGQRVKLRWWGLPERTGAGKGSRATTVFEILNAVIYAVYALEK